MSNNTTSRTSRIEAKYKGHRSEERFFAARNNAKQACQNLRTAIRKSHIHTVMRDELVQAADRAEALVKDVEPSRVRPGAGIRQLAKEIEHLQFAEQWVAAADRVLSRLGNSGPVDARSKLEQAQDAVKWCVRANEWNGQLTAAGAQLQKAVAEAEIHAARVS